MTATQPPVTAHRFAMRFSSTPRGARLARRLCGHRLDDWGVPYGSERHDAVILVVAELCANAVRHGHVAGRDFHVLLTADPAAATVRVEVSDTGCGDGGRGLLLVEALADRWGCTARAEGGPGKTVWAECATPGLT
ncbi:ATP-binding protein [Streptomyces bobili]|uniref:ATP-binding protein n=1 Tax=Streptomyces bobili TaxID=67280 RepID=A0ABZ1QTV9_9ACTN|nr:ATP-binding protein [Streptomyces bobili]